MTGAAAPTLLERFAARLSERKAQPVQFLQIGAMDGLYSDPIQRMVKRHHWHGLLVEPMPHYFQRLQHNYHGHPGLQFANVAIGKTTGMQDFYYIDPEAILKHDLPEWTQGISSLLDSHIPSQERFFKLWHKENISQYVSQTQVKTLTLPMLLEEYKLPPIDLLQIDAEGYDLLILLQWDFKAHKPSIINLEFARLSESEKKTTTDTLLKHDYMISLQGLDVLAVLPELAF